MVNMGELFAYARIGDVEMDCVPVSAKENCFLLEPGDLLFARQSLVLEGAGQCSIFFGNGKPTVFESHIIRCRLDQRIADPEFYFYLFRSPAGRSIIEQIVEQGAGASGIRGSDLANLPVPVPPLKLQRSTTSVLRAIDDRIDLLRQTNTILEAIAQALFKSWFVDFDPVRAKAEGREPEGMDAATAALFPNEFEESELGQIPKGWRVVPSGSTYDVGIGKTPPRKESHWFSESPKDIPWASIRDMGASGVFLASTAEYLTREAIDRFNVRTVPDWTVLLSFKLTVGRLSITDGEMATNEAIAHFTLKKGSLPSSYLYCYLQTFRMDSLGSTSSIATATNSKAIRGLPLLHPGSDLSGSFDAFASPLFERIRVNQRAASTLERLRDTLLPRLISGKLRLPKNDGLIEDAAT